VAGASDLEDDPEDKARRLWREIGRPTGNRWAYPLLTHTAVGPPAAEKTDQPWK
jgi:hypothetical protein